MDILASAVSRRSHEKLTIDGVGELVFWIRATRITMLKLADPQSRGAHAHRIEMRGETSRNGRGFERPGARSDRLRRSLSRRSTILTSPICSCQRETGSCYARPRVGSRVPRAPLRSWAYPGRRSNQRSGNSGSNGIFSSLLSFPFRLPGVLSPFQPSHFSMRPNRQGLTRPAFGTDAEFSANAEIVA